MPGLADRLCAEDDPVVAYRARRLLMGESEWSGPMRRLREAIATSTMARRLLLALEGPPLNPYAKWQGPHWTLYSLAEAWFPPGRAALLRVRDRVLDWLLEPAFLRPPRSALCADQPERPRRRASQDLTIR